MDLADPEDLSKKGKMSHSSAESISESFSVLCSVFWELLSKNMQSNFSQATVILGE